MEKINSVSELAFILMGSNGSTPLSSILVFILSCIILNWVVLIQAFFSSFCFFLQTTTLFLRNSLNDWTRGKNYNATASTSRPNCTDEDVKTEALIMREDVEIVMEKLGICWDPNEEKFQERLDFDNLSTLFNDAEPSLEEVKEAFDVFDENKDGYIDAKDLEKILSALGYVEISKSDCQRMIMAFDNSGDRRLEFNQFLKIIEDSFC